MRVIVTALLATLSGESVNVVEFERYGITVSVALMVVPPPPPAPSATFAPLMRAVSSFAVLLYQSEPLLGVEGSPAIEPTFSPAFVVPGLNVCSTSSGNEIAPLIVGITMVGDVPNEVSDDAVTPAARVAPVSVPASAVTVMFAVPSNDVPLIVRAVCNAVAVPALPETLVWSPVLVPLTEADAPMVSVRATSPSAIVRVRPAVKTSALAIVRSKAAPVDRMPSAVSAV